MEETVIARFGRYLAGEMEAGEKTRFEHQLEENPQLKAEFSSYQRIWLQTATLPDENWDTNAAWARFSDSQLTSGSIPAPRRISLYWAVAASLLVLVTATYFLFIKTYPTTYRYAADGDNTIELADGSVVHLNRGSALTVFPFTRDQRVVTLAGEAFFEVSPDPKKLFMISCGKTVTEVLGTSFDLRQSKDDVLLFVHTGKVIFRMEGAKDAALALTAGEAASFEGNRMKMIPNPSINNNAWHTRQLWFKDMSLAEVAQEVSLYFNQPVIIENNAVKNCIPGSTFPYKNPEIKSLLQGIATTMNAELVIEGNSYVIRGGSCK